jgi:hypothetical protein
MMFSKDTMPSIFSLADTSSRALRKWIISDLPDHVGHTNSLNRYSAVITGSSARPAVMIRLSSVENGDIFDVSYKQSTSGGSVTIRDKSDFAKVLFTGKCNNDADCADLLNDGKRRLVVPLNRYNIHHVCGSEDLLTVCIHDPIVKPGAPVMEKSKITDGETLHQRVYVSGSPEFELDITAATIIVDNEMRPVDIVKWIDEKFPMGILEQARLYAVPLTVAAMVFMGLLVVAKLGPVQITIAIAGMSILIGIINAVGTGAILNKLKQHLR